MTALPLELQLEEADRKLEEKKQEIRDLQREQSLIVREKEEIEAEIEARKSADRVNLEVTDHAVIRYLERVKGMNVSEIKDEILNSCSHAKGLEDAADFNLFTGDYKLVVKGSKVITVLDRK